MHPIAETFRYGIFALLSMLNAVFCGTLVNEITEDSKIQWSKAPHTSSFYLCVGILSLMILAFRIDYSLRKRQTGKLKDAALEALVNSQFFPTVATRMTEAAQNGNTEDFDTLEAFLAKLEKWERR